jgi:HEAT repeat protein
VPLDPKTKIRAVIAALVAGVLIGGCSKAPLKMTGPKWEDALHAPDAKLRKKAAFKLGNIGRTDPAVVPSLIDALNDADAGVRCETILSLVKIGPEAKKAIPQLAEVEQHDNDERVRTYAAKALDKLH